MTMPMHNYAVRAQRHEAADALDFFPTPPWATRALCNEIEGRWGCLDTLSCWEPACGQGDMVRPLREYFQYVYATDVAPFGGERRDFLFPLGEDDGRFRRFDWIITNPPFKLAEEFAHVAIERARVGVALFVRTAFLESVGRFERLFSMRSPTAILQFTERVPLHKGKLTETGSTATAYCWVVWYHDEAHEAPTGFYWIPPCRKRLEKPGDYPCP